MADSEYSTEDHNDLRETVRAFCGASFDEASVRLVMESADGFDHAVWRRLAGEMGLAGLAVPAEFGGSGAGPVEAGIVFEELGRAVAPVPYFGTAGLAVPVLLAVDDRDAAKEYLPSIAAGETIATVAVHGSVSVIDGALGGSVSYVVDGMAADLILVAADGVLYAVSGSATGLEREPLPVMDLTRRQARLTFRSVPARAVGSADVLRPALDVAAALLAASSVGGAQHVLDMAVGYASTRYQFGRAIGSFQAIKHRCADLLAEVESARSVAYHALWAASDRSEPGRELPLAAALAGSYCSEAFLHAALENVQIHGGIGFTWEHPAHLYVKRAVSDRALLSSPDSHRHRLAALAGL
ncbi:MAG TPA: acyl-CoA dehydrogenase family protein [Streptosporangiaceae bacterium]|nr:acyl-CoA dehydrogenase family protein [Streptosporangiaceae bacterium]